MEVLITGGLGLIGSTLAPRLRASGHRVHIVDSLDPRAGGSAENVRSSYEDEPIIACISDPSIWEKLPTHLDFVVNLAGLSGHNYSMMQPAEDLAVNVVAQATFLKQLVSRGKQPHIIFASTRQVYGVDPSRSEGDIRPADVNAVGQYACEQLHEVLVRGSQARVTILRLSNVYGPAMLRSATPQGVIGAWLQSAAEGNELRVTLPSPVRDLLHVEDLADLILLILQEGSPPGSEQVFDVGGGSPVRLEEVAEHLSKESGSTIARSMLSADEARVAVSDYITDLSRVCTQYNWIPSRDWRREFSAIIQEARHREGLRRP